MNRRGCEQLEELLQLYASGQATADERRLVEEHLAECPACRETLKYIRRVDAFIAGQPELPACMAARLPRIDEGVESGIGRRRFLPPWLAGRALNLAASLATVVAAGLMALGLWLALSQVQPATDPIVVPGPPTPHSVPGDASLGRIAFTREGDIWVKELPEGEARRITQDGANDTPLWSPSGEWLAFRKGKQAWVARASGADAHQVQGDDVGQYSWSPTSDRLAYVTTEGLFVVDADGSDRRELAKSTGGFAWSPDGQWLAFEKAEQVGQQPPTAQGLWRMRVDGTEAQPVYLNPDPVESQSRLAGWSPDGQYLLYWSGMLQSSSMAADGLPLMRVPVSGGTPVEIAGAMLVYSDYLDWSPDGRRLAFVDGGGRMSWDNKRIAVADTTGEQRVLSEQGRADLFPAWSPDGSLIAYTSGPAAPGVGGGDPAKQAMAQRHIWVIAPDGSGKRELTDDPAYRDERPRWSKDGAFILFARIKDEQVQVWTMRADGSERRLVADDLSVAATGMASPSIWFGYYGNIGWRQLYDWWRGAPKSTPSPAPTSKATPAAVTEAPTPTATQAPTAQLVTSIEYRNDQYGFAVELPPSWAGFATVVDEWQGDAIGSGGEFVLGAERGPMISIRHPQWTTEKPRQDIPIIVLTLAQWNSLRGGKFHIGAAPVNPREL
ncbi:MAG: zf-HC2 domain-containing protein, partial [Chloroflexota bacterium]